MNNDYAAQRLSNSGRLAGRFRTKGKMLLYYLLTGYWSTGERVHPLHVNNNYINHLRVYQFISQFVSGRDVLDVGCGVGYGTSFLGRTANRAVGIDYSAAAIEEAYRLYPEAEFAQMDAQDMTFQNESFDVIVSTENFEHLRDQERNVAEMARIVRKSGFCFIATPNPELFVGVHNPYHVKENTHSELRALLISRFRQVEIIEPTSMPTSPEGRAAREERFARGDHGILVDKDLKIFGQHVKQTFLSNTHSFNCFIREPIDPLVAR